MRTEEIFLIILTALFLLVAGMILLSMTHHGLTVEGTAVQAVNK